MGRPLRKDYLHGLYVYANVDGAHIDSGETVIKQVRTRGYKVNATHGVGTCNLVASDTPVQGEMYTVAKDSDNNTYWVIKLTRHKATLVQRTLVGSAYQFANNLSHDEAVKHVFGSSPVAGESVQLVNFD